MIIDLKARLNEMGLKPKKSFGQNFLVSKGVIGKIIAELEHHRFRDLVEIGPGLGALTEELLSRGMRPRLIELDRELVNYWRQRGLDVIDADALKLEWGSLHLRDPSLLLSNLPYQISTHLVVDRCFGPSSLKWMILMFQKEVAERLTAAPGGKAYGLLSVMAQLHFDMRRVCDAGPGDFFPPPKVASRVLRFERRPDPGLGPRFLKFVKHAFAFRRKFLLKNLKGVVDKPKLATLSEVFERMGVDTKARAEQLSPAQFAEMYRVLNEH